MSAGEIAFGIFVALPMAVVCTVLYAAIVMCPLFVIYCWVAARS